MTYQIRQAGDRGSLIEVPDNATAVRLARLLRAERSDLVDIVVGHTTVLAPKAVTYHRLHGSFSQLAYTQRLRLFERNALAMIYKNYESATLALHRSHARPDRYCLVRYEDLVARPADVLERVCKVVGVAPEPERMLEMAAGEATESSFADQGLHGEYDGRIRRTDAVDRAQRIDAHELEAIRSVCAPLAHLLGYDVAPLRRRRASLGQPVPGRVPWKVGAAFAAARVRKRLSS